MIRVRRASTKEHVQILTQIFLNPLLSHSKIELAGPVFYVGTVQAITGGESRTDQLSMAHHCNTTYMNADYLHFSVTRSKIHVRKSVGIEEGGMNDPLVEIPSIQRSNSRPRSFFTVHFHKDTNLQG
jgi:hypothetical protein